MRRLVFASFLLLSSCLSSMPNGWKWYQPRFLYMKGSPQLPEDSDYQKGWVDGCWSHTVIGAGGIFRAFPARYDGWKLTGKNPKTGKPPHPEIKDPGVYQSGVGDGEEHCFYYWDWDSV